MGLILVFATCIWGIVRLAQPAEAETNTGWILAICFVMMLVFTFLPPIVMTGLITLFLVLAVMTISGTAKPATSA